MNSNFSLDLYYQQAHSGDKVNNNDILNYIRSFKRVYLWGASYLGAAIGKYLQDNQVPFEKYWDRRAAEIGLLNGVEVIHPFQTDVEKQDTLVIYCIGNNVIRSVVLQKLLDKGFNHIIRGDYFYMGAVCPFDKSTGVESAVCQGTMCCRAIFCQRLSDIIASRSESSNQLHMFSVTVIVNQKCSLRCKHCTSYMNEYPVQERINIPTERILQDIDLFFNAMDSLGTVTVMGGEPFMHPDISMIVRHLLTKRNFGLVSVATSGTFPIKPEMLDGFDDPRINISFSNYEQAINEKLVANMYRSIETVKSLGIAHTVGVIMPEWSMPSTLYDLGDTVEVMIKKKNICPQPPRCMQIKNGFLHPCDFGTATFSLGICKKEGSALDLRQYENTASLKKAIAAFIDQPYYPPCGYCARFLGSVPAAEQGYVDMKQPLIV